MSLPSTQRLAISWARLAWLGAVALSAVPAQAGDPWGGSLSLSTDYVFRGVSQSRRQAALQADLNWRSPLGWFAGAWASTADPYPGGLARYEINLYAGRSWILDERWGAALRAVHYAYPDSPFGTRYDTDEFAASLEFEDRVVLSLAASPNATRYSSQGLAPRRRAWAAEASLRQPLGLGVSAVAALGHYDTQALFGTAYRAWSAGLAARIGPVQATLSRYGADAAARRLFPGDGAGGRWVLSAAWHF